jgi:hypothetical protein
MVQSKKNKRKNSLWLPIDLWNLNELFTTESISPISYYRERNFGNPVNRNQGIIEDINNLILFDEAIQNSILLEVSNSLLDRNFLTEIKSSNKGRLKSYEYSKTIYLKNGQFNVYFSSREKLNEFLNNTFMLLEVKTTNKYKDELRVIDVLPETKAFYQSKLISDKPRLEPFYDKAFNQIKGLIYGYLIGSIGTLGEKEQCLVSDLSKLKNSIGRTHTDIALSEEYNGLWLINIRKQIKDCQKSYFDNFGNQSDVLDTLLLRLEEIDNLNKMRCFELSKQKSHSYKNDFEKELNSLEKIKLKLYRYEDENEITFIREELNQIKQEEKRRGEIKGKTREYYKIGTEEYERKQELKNIILKLEENDEYLNLKREVITYEERLRNFQFGMTQFDTSITEQFSRISEYLHEVTKNTTNDFLSINNKSKNIPDISIAINTLGLRDFYYNNKSGFEDFNIVFPTALSTILNESELQLLSGAVNSILSKPQGRLGNFSEQNILEIIKNIGEHLPENSFKQTLRDYYKYRIGKNDNFNFPVNSVMANIIVFLMKINGHDQINKMLVTKNTPNRQIAFLLYGAYLGFANLPKTFTNIVFDSDNTELLNYIDNYFFNNYINIKL